MERIKYFLYGILIVDGLLFAACCGVWLARTLGG